jgi:branched-chain amino acid transport system substrate-binding protein
MTEGLVMQMKRSALAAAGLMAMLVSAQAQAEIRIATASPLTGRLGWLGEQYQRGAELAVEDLNARGGVLGQPVELIAGDTFGDPEQAIALAKALIARQVVFVAGPAASEAAIAAAPVLEEAKIIAISPSASNPKLTESGWRNVFRVFGRDDRQGGVAAAYLADHWADRPIAILDDGTVYGQGLAAETKKHLNARGITEALYRAYEPGGADYFDLIDEMRAAGIEVAYVGGRSTEVGLMARGSGSQGYDLQLVSGDAIGTLEFWLMSGPAGEGTLFTSGPDARTLPAAASLVRRWREVAYEPENYTLYTYAAVQVWAQAVEKAGSLDYEAVLESLHRHKFDTVLGKLRFDNKGDVKGFEPFVWYVWRDGEYVPAKID